MFEIGHYIKEAGRRKEKKEALLADSTKLDTAISKTLAELSPNPRKQVFNSRKYNTRLEATDAGIPSGHPMSGFGEELQEQYKVALKDPKLRGLDHKQILQILTKNMMLTPGKDGVSRLEASHIAKLRADTSVMNLFGLLGEDEDVRALPGFEEYKQEVSDRPGETHWMHPGESFAYGAGFSLMGSAVKKGMVKAGISMLGRKLVTTPNPWAAAVGAGLMAIPMFMGWDAASNVIAKTDYGKAREGTWEKIGVDLLLGGVMGGAVIHKGITKGISKAVEKELLSKTAIRVMMKDPTAAKAIIAGETSKAARIEAGRIDAILKEKIEPREVTEHLMEIDAFRQSIKTGKVIDTTKPYYTKDELRKIESKRLSTIDAETKRVYHGIGVIQKQQAEFGLTRAEKISEARLTPAAINHGLDEAKRTGKSIAESMWEREIASRIATKVAKQEKIGIPKGIPAVKPSVGKAEKSIIASIEAPAKNEALIARAGEKGVESYTWASGEEHKIVKLTKELYNSLKGEGDLPWSKVRKDRFVSLMRGPGKEKWRLGTTGSLHGVRPAEANAGKWRLEGELTFGKARVLKDAKVKTEVAGTSPKLPKDYKGKRLTKEEISKLIATDIEEVVEVPKAVKKGKKTTVAEVEKLADDAYAVQRAEELGINGEELLKQKSTDVTSKVLDITDKLTGYEAILGKIAQSYKPGDKISAKNVSAILGRTFKKDMSVEKLEGKINGELDKLEKQLGELEDSVVTAGSKSMEKVKSNVTPEQWQAFLDESLMKEGRGIGKEVEGLTIVDDALLSTGAFETQVDDILTAAEKGEVSKASKKLLAIIGLISVPLLSLFTPPDTAEAGMADTMARAVVPKLLANKAAKAATVDKTMKSYISDWIEAGMVFIRAPEGSKVMAKAQNVLSTAPIFMKEVGGKGISGIIKTTKQVIPLMSKMSPFTVMDLTYHQGRSAAPELAMRQGAIANMVRDNTQVFANICDLVPAIKNEKAMRTIIEETTSLALEYDGLPAVHRVAEMRMERLIPKLTKGQKSLKKDARRNKRALKKIGILDGEIAKTQKALTESEPAFREFEKKVAVKYQDLARRFASTRIALATEDTAGFTVYPWLKSLMKPDELEAVSYIKLMNQTYAKRIEAAGMDTIKGPYIHHAFHPSWNPKVTDQKLAEFGLESSGIPFSKFFRRQKYSKMLVPDISYTQQKYILDAERRIQWNLFWGKGKTDSWYAHRNSLTVKNSPVLEKVWAQIETSMIPPADTKWNTLMNRYAAFEVFRLLGFSGSVPFKHWFKNIGTASVYGIGEFGSHIPQATRMTFRNAKNSPEMEYIYKKLGVTTAKGKKKILDDVINSIIFQSRGMNMIADLDLVAPISDKAGFGGAFDRVLRKINSVGSVPVRAVEALDRHHTVLAGMTMAAKKGMTPNQAMYAVYSNVLKNNFLSGSMNPEWMRNPSLRALLLFQNTAQKIFERRLVTAYNVGKDVTNVGKVITGRIKNHEIPQLLKELKELGQHMLNKEFEFKQNMIYDALSRDVMGRSYVRQGMTEAILAGGILGAGGAVGMDLMPQVWHLPFQKHGATEATVAVNPILSAFLTNFHKREKAREYDEDTEFFIPGFLKSYFSSTGYMNMTMWKLFRGIRRAEDDIPETYKGSWLQYFFSVPGTEE